MKKFGLKSVKHHDRLFFDLRNDPSYDSYGNYLPPMKLITFKAVDEKDAVCKLQDTDFCISIGLEYWLFEPYRLVQFNK